MRQKSLRVNMFDFLSNLQILYQNNQIDTQQKDEISMLARKCLSSNLYNEELSNVLRNIKQSVDLEFKDLVYECLEFIE